MKKIKKLAETLASVDEATLEKIEEFEREGKFNEHVGEAGEYIPVDENYVYLTRNPFKKLNLFFKRQFIVKPFMRYSNELFSTEVRGYENLKAVGKAGCIVTCNHVNKLDCMAIDYALKGKRVYKTAAEFNNFEGFLGEMMRVGGLLPMSANFKAMKNLDAAITKLLSRGRAVAFFPERSEWWGYEKPRPMLSGAFKYAAKNKVAVLPLFITFKPQKDRGATGLKQFVVNVLPPIYPDGSLSPYNAAQKLMEQNQIAWQNCYENFYGKKP